jgi:hypothetical protein
MRRLFDSLALASFLLAACGESANDMLVSHQHGAGSSVLSARVDGPTAVEVARLRRLVAPLHQLSAANEAGFDVQDGPCVAIPEGGMGYHWGNLSRIDGSVRWDEPEFLVFAPSPDAKDGVKFAAVEYVVPMALSATPPVLFGQTFVPGGPGGTAWTLHVWIGIENPSGLFAPWNPRVTCP